MKQHRIRRQQAADGLFRELRIRWRLLRRQQRFGPKHALLAVVVLVSLWIAAGLYQGYRSDVALNSQLGGLRQQSASLSRQVHAEKEELRSASSKSWQEELARAAGLIPKGEGVYVIESSEQAAGSAPVTQGTQLAGQAASTIASAIWGG